MFLSLFFQLLSLLRFCVNFLVKVKGPLYDDGVLMVTFSAHLRNNQHQNLHIFIPLLPFACVDESNRLKLSKRRSWFFPQELYKADFTKALTKFLPQKSQGTVVILAQHLGFLVSVVIGTLKRRFKKYSCRIPERTITRLWAVDHQFT